MDTDPDLNINNHEKILRSPYLLVIGLAFVGACAGIPYHLDYIRITTDIPATSLLPQSVISANIFFQLFIPAAIASVIGLFILERAFPWAFRFPLPGQIVKVPTMSGSSIILVAILVGMVMGLFLTLLTPVSNYLIPGFSGNTVVYLLDRIAPWKGLLAAVSAGIIEELEYRLCFMTLFVWIGTRLVRVTEPSRAILWVANLIAILPFGFMHLNNVIAAGGQITPISVGIVLFGNGICGLAFGVLYWRNGLSSAIIAHMVMDIILYALVPFLLLL
ncbi:MAG: CPBP family glutamic-type intramembrane protease [Methanoregula sp.]|nr:CPBP family glutamic-type intramembrane protease [Methanoregula sp.]